MEQCFLNFFKKHTQFRCTGLVPSRNLVYLEDKSLTGFIQILTCNLLKLVLSSRRNCKWLENSQNWNTPQNHIHVPFNVSGLTSLLWQSRKTVLSLFFDSFSLSNAKKLPMKAFLELNLVSLTVRGRTVS